MYSALLRETHLQSAQVRHMSRDHTVLPATHTFFGKWNEPYLPLLSSRKASPHFSRYSFSVPLTIEDGHPSQYRPGPAYKVTSSIETNALPLSQTATYTIVEREQSVITTALYIGETGTSTKKHMNNWPGVVTRPRSDRTSSPRPHDTQPAAPPRRTCEP